MNRRSLLRSFATLTGLAALPAVAITSEPKKEEEELPPPSQKQLREEKKKEEEKKNRMVALYDSNGGSTLVIPATNVTTGINGNLIVDNKTYSNYYYVDTPTNPCNTSLSVEDTDLHIYSGDVYLNKEDGSSYRLWIDSKGVVRAVKEEK